MDLVKEVRQAKEQYEEENPVELIIRDKHGRTQKSMRMGTFTINKIGEPITFGVGGNYSGLNR